MVETYVSPSQPRRIMTHLILQCGQHLNLLYHAETILPTYVTCLFLWHGITDDQTAHAFGYMDMMVSLAISSLEDAVQVNDPVLVPSVIE